MSTEKSLTVAAWLYAGIALLLALGVTTMHFSGRMTYTQGKLISLGLIFITTVIAAIWVGLANKRSGRSNLALVTYCGFVALGVGNLVGNIYIALLLAIPYGFVIHAWRRADGNGKR
jgi:NO-binding membrane sensor protein with MHYT domain